MVIGVLIVSIRFVMVVIIVICLLNFIWEFIFKYGI